MSMAKHNAKLLVKIAERVCIVTPEQANTLAEVFSSCEWLDRKWVGTNAGTDGTGYETVLKRPAFFAAMPTETVSETTYSALYTMMVARDAEQAAKS